VVRQGLIDYLRDANDDAVEFSYRLENARITCAFLFELPPQHDFLSYFTPEKKPELEIKAPSFLAALNRGRVDPTANLERLLEEFDRLGSVNE